VLRAGRVGVGRVGAIVVVYAGFFFVVYLAAIYAVPRVSREMGRLAGEGREFFGYVNEHGLDRAVTSIANFLARQEIDVDTATVRQEVDEALRRVVEATRAHFFDVLTAGQRIVAGLVRAVFTFFLVLMVTGFLLLDWERLRSFVFTLVPIQRRPDYDRVMARIDRGLSGVVRGQLVICLVNGTLTLAGLLLVGIKYPVVLALTASVFSLIPIFGSILSTIPIVAIGLTSGLLKAVSILAWIIGIHLLEANLLNPKIMGDATRIHPVLIVFAVVAGERFYGVPGALFAVPVASIVITLFKFTHRKALDLGGTD
jgi:predicted PurR-regulated permease PerM